MNRKAVIIGLAVIALIVIVLIAYISSDKPEENTEPMVVELPVSPKAKLSEISITEEEQKTLGIRKAQVSNMLFKKTTRLSGSITYDPEMVSEVISSFNGTVENVAVEDNKYVSKGDKLLDINCPEVVEAQKELISASRQKPVKDAQLQEARERLRNFKLSDDVIRKIEETGTYSTILTIISPTTGYITKTNISKGSKLSVGDDLIIIADLSRVIFSASAPEDVSSMLKRNLDAEILIESYPQKIFKTKIEDIQPGSSSEMPLIVEMKLLNSDNALKPGMSGFAEIKIDLGTKLAVPLEAIMEKDGKKIVYVQITDELFSARAITTGINFDSMTEVTQGLSNGEMVVSSGVTKVDSMAASQTMKQE